MKRVSIVVPVYMGEKVLFKLFNRIVEVFNGNKEYEPEVIFVFDCGNPTSWEIIKQIKEENSKLVKAIHLSRNFGQHNALICGFEDASGDFVVTIDEDLQQDPKDIFILLEKQKVEDFDVVYGRFPELKHSFFRTITSRILKRLLKIGIPDLHPDYSALRLIKSDIAKAITKMQNSYTFLDGYISWITTNISSSEVSHNKREEGKSSYNIRYLVEHSINIFVTFSNFPIRFLTFLSIFLFLVTIIYSIVIAWGKIVGKIDVPGYASIVITVGLGVGFILLGLGIVGEYIYRINLKTTKRPNFFVRKKII